MHILFLLQIHQERHPERRISTKILSLQGIAKLIHLLNGATFGCDTDIGLHPIDNGILENAVNRNFMCFGQFSNPTDNAQGFLEGNPNVKGTVVTVLHFQIRCLWGEWQRRLGAAFSTRGGGNAYDIGHHRIGRLESTGTRTTVGRRTQIGTGNDHGIAIGTDTRKGMILWNHLGCHVYRQGSIVLAIFGQSYGSSDEFDGTIQQLGIFKIDRSQAGYALAGNILDIGNGLSVGQFGHDGNLGTYVMSLHIGSGIGFGVSQILCFLQDGIVVIPLFHPIQHEIGRSITNTLYV
mmetsp:Transcript_16814/g.38701  ORF Transcript_16814/g.38701 Transcript_16814/m.38701 type:complete len:293 (+) Transcript_16814:707-1585(+)